MSHSRDTEFEDKSSMSSHRYFYTDILFFSLLLEEAKTFLIISLKAKMIEACMLTATLLHILVGPAAFFLTATAKSSNR